MSLTNRSFVSRAVGPLLALALSASVAAAQGVTTADVDGVVKDTQGAVVPGATVVAVHEPSGTSYNSVTQVDGHFRIQGMRVGGPYKVTVSLSGFNPEVKGDITLNLGLTTDLDFTLKIAARSETVTVVATDEAVFSSAHTGAATAVNRTEIGTLPTISGRINDFARLSPQYGGSGTFSGQDNRANNITIDGSYFNNSFGLAGQPGDRTNVAPVSLEAIEQIQVSVAPYDVRQANFVGANLNTVTRSGTNLITASVYHRTRDQSYVGTNAAGLSFNPGTFTTKDTGEWAGGPIIKSKLFAFESYESQEDTRPLSTFRSNAGGEPVGGNITRVLTSDLTGLSSFLASNFDYQTGPFDNLPKNTPGKPFLIKGDYSVNGSNKITFRYNRLDSSTNVYQSSSTALGVSRPTNSTNFLTFQNATYQILENIGSGVGEWHSAVGSRLANALIIGYTHQDESRAAISLFPFVEIDDGNGLGYTSFGSEPFTPNNELRYNTFQLQNNLTLFKKGHSVTLGVSVEKYHSDNVFFPGKQSAYTYSTLADFYTDAAGYLANSNRTVSPITLRRFQVRYTNIPGQAKPVQPLDVWYSGGYAQDEWRPRGNLTITAGVRVDVARFGDTAYDNANADALTFRDSDGSPIQYNSGKLPDAHPLWSPRIGLNWDVSHDQKTQVRGGTGVFTGKPPYVWISNQVGNTGVLTGFIQTDNTTAYPFNPNPDTYKPTTVTGAPAASYELDVTDQGFRFPQTWRSNVGLDRRLPWGLIATGEFIYNRDINDPFYINANLPAAESHYTGIDNRPRWVATPAFPTCASAGQVGPCVTRLNNAPGNQVTSTIVLKNTNQDRSWNVAASVSKALQAGFSLKAGYSYGVARGIVEPGSTAAASWNGNQIVADPNNPALAYSGNSPGQRVFIAGMFTRQYLGFGATTISVFYDGHTNGNTQYVFSGDANGDTGGSNDLIYIPRNTSEMNFVTFTTTAGKTFTAADQAAAFEQYIEADPYLSKHRGQYAERGAIFLPMVNRIDLSLTQDVFHNIGGKRHSGQVRLDITNFGNLLNHNWGVGTRLVNSAILTNPVADASGALSYRMQLFNGNLITSPFQTSAGIGDVYVMMLSFRYSFQ
jgi:hypothetical protein